MIFKQLNTGSCRTYVVGSDRTREAILIDPLLDPVDRYLAFLAAEGLKLRWVVDTHSHADHASGAAAIQERARVDYVMHRSSTVPSVSRRLRERDVIGLGELVIKFLHVPGHTPDSMLIVLPDRFLSGDFLFIGEAGAGRLDQPGASVEAHFQSLRKLDRLPDTALMFPGHEWHGRESSVLKSERETNPVLRPRTLEQYVEFWEKAADELRGKGQAKSEEPLP